MILVVKEKWSRWLPYILMLLAALSRWPRLFPPNFSAFYALAFCAGAFFPARMKWWLPLGTIVISDIALDIYYHFALHINAFTWFQLITYAGFICLIWLGTRFNHKSRFSRLLLGGIAGACVFYLLTNILAWFFNPFGNPEYVKNLT
ncbi:MAG TPA: DUF6580 family putative transport protein, partial [Verrucomicrobiae bacterium]|nr:DUF6580 family putative transport protein [Verrucomicrobiae bacterium]